MPVLESHVITDLERAHTREYFKHVAEWESKARRRKDDVTRDERGWPEPRPQRKETMEDKAEYSHLHYFKVSGHSLKDLAYYFNSPS